MQKYWHKTQENEKSKKKQKILLLLQNFKCFLSLMMINSMLQIMGNNKSRHEDKRSISICWRFSFQTHLADLVGISIILNSSNDKIPFKYIGMALNDHQKAMNNNFTNLFLLHTQSTKWFSLSLFYVTISTETNCFLKFIYGFHRDDHFPS